MRGMPLGLRIKQPASEARVKTTGPGESAYSVVVGETSFPALHATLVKVGGHLIQRSEECEERRKHKIPHKKTHRALQRNEGKDSVKGKAG